MVLPKHVKDYMDFEKGLRFTRTLFYLTIIHHDTWFGDIFLKKKNVIRIA